MQLMRILDTSFSFKWNLARLLTHRGRSVDQNILCLRIYMCPTSLYRQLHIGMVLGMRTGSRGLSLGCHLFADYQKSRVGSRWRTACSTKTHGGNFRMFHCHNSFLYASSISQLWYSVKYPTSQLDKCRHRPIPPFQGYSCQWPHHDLLTDHCPQCKSLLLENKDFHFGLSSYAYLFRACGMDDRTDLQMVYHWALLLRKQCQNIGINSNIYFYPCTLSRSNVNLSHIGPRICYHLYLSTIQGRRGIARFRRTLTSQCTGNSFDWPSRRIHYWDTDCIIMIPLYSHLSGSIGKADNLQKPWCNKMALYNLLA